MRKLLDLEALRSSMPRYTCRSIDNAIRVVDRSSLDIGEASTITAELEALRSDNETLREIAEGALELADNLTTATALQRDHVVQETVGYCSVHGDELVVATTWEVDRVPKVSVAPCSRCLQERYMRGHSHGLHYGSDE